MNVLIVDDEYFACAALEKLVTDYFKERKRPFSCVVFDQSKRALEYLNETNVDLVMTDIRMSEMNGLELALQIQGMKQETETVVISGYAEFTYAQKALKYNVVDYLLKPISRGQIYECLDKRVENYDRKCKLRTHTIFQKIVSNRELTAEHLLEESKKKKFDQVVMVMISGDRKQLEIYKKDIYEMEAIKGIWRLLVESPKGNKLLLIYYGLKSERSNLEDRVVKHCNMCCRNQKETAEAVLFCVSSTHEVSIPLYELYAQSKLAMNGRLINPDKRLFEYCKLIENKGYEEINASSLEYELKQSFEFKEKDLTKKLIHKQIKAVTETNNPSLSQISDMIRSLVITINKVINAYNYKTEKEVEDIKETLLSQFSSVEEMLEYFDQHIERIYREMFTENPVQNIVERLLEYVQENYFSNISLTEISKNVLFLNPSYVSRLFKAQMEISFSKYLLNYRLEKAMECIQNDMSASVQEVAILTGFYDCSYFVKQFKRQYGETPGYYQRHSRKIKENIEVET